MLKPSHVTAAGHRCVPVIVEKSASKFGSSTDATIVDKNEDTNDDRKDFNSVHTIHTQRV